MTKAKELVIYHANCTDGFSAAWVFHHHANTFPEAAGRYDFYAGNYGSPPPDLTDYEVVYLVDFSYPKHIVLEMLEGRSVVLIDHHATAIEDLKDVQRLIRCTDIDRSGAVLAWDYLFPETPRPTILGYVQDRDLWQFKLPMSKETGAYIGSLKRTFEAWDILMTSGGNVATLAGWAAQGTAIMRVQSKIAEELARGAVTLPVFCGHEGIPVCNAPGAYASDVGHILCEGVPFSMTFHFAHGKMMVSLRSRPEGADVSQVAKCYGGGGHKHAAGFVVKSLNLEDAFPEWTWDAYKWGVSLQARPGSVE